MIDTVFSLKFLVGLAILLAFIAGLVRALMALLSSRSNKPAEPVDPKIEARRAQEAARRRMVDLEAKAEQLAKTFVRHTVPFLNQYFRDFVEKEVVNHPDKAKQLGQAGLATLKKELERVIQHNPERAERYLDEKFPWPHRSKSFGITSQSKSIERLETGLKERVRYLLGYMGKLLVKNGFSKSGPEAEWRPVEGGKRLMYAWGVDWSPEMLTTWNEYVQIEEELKQLKLKMSDAERDKEKNEAKKLWEAS